MDDVEERFKKAVIGHEMIIVREDGMHRHFTFKSSNSYNYHFHITTWPGYLAISGDGGCYVFARLPDMFRFFRGSGINPGYWGEKLQAIERNGGYREFSEELFHAAIKSDFDQWSFKNRSQQRKAWKALQESDLSKDNAPQSLDDALRAAMDYECPVTKNRFNDFWEHDLQDYSFRFLWCCHAVRWAVAEYDRRSGFPHKRHAQTEGAPIGAG